MVIRVFVVDFFYHYNQPKHHTSKPPPGKIMNVNISPNEYVYNDPVPDWLISS